MGCYYPLQGYRSKKIGESGKRAIVFNPNEAISEIPVHLPCGQCIGCRLEKSRQWAIRCVHESQLHENNIFITLTYSDAKMPLNKSLNNKHIQNFLKRLRKSIQPKKIRFFQCGEYSDPPKNRPHYHMILFNHDFSDKKIHKEENGNRLYTSQTLENLWTHGHAIIGSVTFESAAYVARYILKKINGKDAENHYNGRKPEYITMSRGGTGGKGGIGQGWYEKYSKEIYPNDYVIIRGKKIKPPKYYDLKTDPEEFLPVKQKRNLEQEKQKSDNTHDRLMVKQAVLKASLTRLKRHTEQI